MIGIAAALPGWLIVPAAGATMFLIAHHVTGLQRTKMPPSRRRIRTANGLLMIFVTALLGYALGIMPTAPSGSANVSEVRSFVFVWGLIIGLMPIVIGLGILDAMNTIRLHLGARKGLRQQLGDKLARDVVIKARLRGQAAATAGAPEDAAARGRIIRDETRGE
ncbi:MAG: hypothetical protein AB7G11_01570 [Phycisphaerales bacterium]